MDDPTSDVDVEREEDCHCELLERNHDPVEGTRAVSSFLN